MATLSNGYQMLDESGYTTFLSSYNGQVALRLYARIEKQDTSANKSKVWIKLVRNITGDYSNVGYSYASASASLSGDLTHTWTDGARDTDYVGEHTIFEEYFEVTHNNEGKCTLTLSAKYDDSYISERSISSVSCDLPTIPRKSPIGSVTYTDGVIERGFSVSFTPASTSFTHRVKLIANNETVASRNGYSAGTTITLTADELLTLYRKNIKTVTVRLITQTNGSNIGIDDESKTLSAIGNVHIKVGDEWKRGVIHVGSKPGIVMIKKDGEWRVAR